MTAPAISTTPAGMIDPTQYSRGAMQAASGYPNSSGNIPPIFAQQFILLAYACTIGGRITQQNTIPGVARETGRSVTFWRSSKATVRPLLKGQALESDSLSASTVTLDINLATYANVTVDVNDVEQNFIFDKFLDSWQVDAIQKTAQLVDLHIFFAQQIQGSPFNRGACAGMTSSSYNLGALGKPLALTAANILTMINRASAALAESNVSTNDSFLVLPICANPLFANNQVLANAWASGKDKSELLSNDQFFDGPVSGFSKIYFSNILPRAWDTVAKQYVYQCPFGRVDATGYIMQANEREMIPYRDNDFGRSWRMRNRYGVKVLMPEAIGAMVVSVTQPDGVASTPVNNTGVAQ